MNNHRFWPPRFSLRGLMLVVLAVAIALVGFDGWRRTTSARNIRAEYERLVYAWDAGVIATPELIKAAENVLDAEQRQWFSSVYEQAIVDSHILRLTRIKDKLRGIAQTGLFPSEEAHNAAWKKVEEVSRLIEEAENLKPHFSEDSRRK